MALLSAGELRRIERAHSTGVSSSVIVDSFQRKGERFSEATLRKYVQLGLLPKSRRVGQRGRHRGSSGLYPVSIVRLINEVKRALDTGATLEEIRFGRVGLLGEVLVLRRSWDDTFDRFARAVEQQNGTERGRFRKVLARHRRALDREIKALDRLAVTVGGSRAKEGS